MSKNFWKRPEGITGALVIGGAVIGTALIADKLLALFSVAMSTTGGMAALLATLTGIVFLGLDSKARTLVWYAYKSVMRWITGLFVQIDPISILKSYIGDLDKKLRQMSKQIGALRGQIRQLNKTYTDNADEIKKNLRLAEEAKGRADERTMALNARKAARLQEANAKYEVLLDRMDVLYKMLTRMYENSEIMLDDTRDQIKLKEQEYEAIKASHSAIQSAMSILKGDPDQLQMFDQATEALADEIGQKIGQMDRFMDTSRNLMDSIDLQSGVFEEDGMRMLEQWEKTGVFTAPDPKEKPLDLNEKRPEILKDERGNNEYHDLFD